MLLFIKVFGFIWDFIGVWEFRVIFDFWIRDFVFVIFFGLFRLDFWDWDCFSDMVLNFLFINNNNGYSGVRHGQKAHFRGKSIGTDPSNGIDFPDFEKVVNAFTFYNCINNETGKYASYYIKYPEGVK